MINIKIDNNLSPCSGTTLQLNTNHAANQRVTRMQPFLIRNRPSNGLSHTSVHGWDNFSMVQNDYT